MSPASGLPVVTVPVGLAGGGVLVGAGAVVVAAEPLVVAAGALVVGAGALVVLRAVVDTGGAEVVVVGRGAAVVLRVDLVGAGVVVPAATAVAETWCAVGWTGAAEVALGHGVTSEAPMTAPTRPEVHNHRRGREGRRSRAARCRAGPREGSAVSGR